MKQGKRAGAEEGSALFSFGNRFQLQHVFGADVSCCKQAQEGCTLCRGLHRRPSAGLFALHDAHDSCDFHARLTRRFNGMDGGSSGRADIVDDHHRSALAAESLDSPPGAVRFFRFAHQEAMQ